MTLEELNNLCKGTFSDLLNIEFTGFSDTRVEAVMPITPELYQPMGWVHGGALIALAETVGSAGSVLMIDTEKYSAVGASVSSQHIAPAKSGKLYAVAEIIVRKEFRHIWDVSIRDHDANLVSISRVTNSIKPKTGNGSSRRQ